MADRIEQIIAHLQAHMHPESVRLHAREAAKIFLLDSVGVALAGGRVPQSGLLLTAAKSWGQATETNAASVWGSPQKLPAPAAAMVNAFHIHNQEFDCVHERAVVHPMAVILAALMAFAERKKNVTGEELLAALALAVDVAAVIGMSATRPITFFRPAQCGALGAAAGMCVLAGFNAAQMRDAFGITYSQLAGTMLAHIEGTPTLALQVGFAARAAVCAVDLAALGFRGPHEVLDGKHGYFQLYERDAAPDPAFAELGQVWQITQVSHKPYPTGRAAQGGIAGLQHLIQTHGFVAEDVAQVSLAAPPLIRQLVDRPMLADGMSVSYARLCLPYLAAVTLVYGNVGLAAYSPALLTDKKLFKIAGRIKLTADDNHNPNALRPQQLTVVLNDGTTLTHAMPHIYGAPEAPMSDAAQEAKFIECCRHALNPMTEEKIEQLKSAIMEINKTSNVASIVELMYSP